MQASSSGSMVGVGQRVRGVAGSTTSAQRVASSGRSPSERTVMTCSGCLGAHAVEVGQDPLEALVVGDQDLGAGVGEPVLHLLGPVHQAFMPTTAAPIDSVAQ
jgi:hypothetical protein